MLSLPGLTYPLNATAVLLRGPAPSRILGLAAQQPSVTSPVGTLSLHSNGSYYHFQQAASVSYHVRQSMRRHGEPILSVSYEDRRWKWRYASVSGCFNERLPDCSIKYSPSHLGYRRSARELFTFVLNAAGDGSGDVSSVPSNIYPACVWQDTPCDEALAQLCAACRCTIVLDASDQVRVVREGSGLTLPSGDVTHPVTSMRIGALPDAIAIGCGPTRFQSKFLLEAVGLDKDGTIKKINDLSYKPSGGWSDQWPGSFPGVDEDDRYLAHRTVWRWYRVKEQASGGLAVPGLDVTVSSPDQYQLTNWLVDVGEDPDEMPRPLPAYVQGSYYPQTDLQANTETKAHLPAPFTIIPEMNLVEFAYPVWYANDGYYEPSLYLTTGYTLKYSDGSGLVRHTKRRVCAHPSVGTKDFVIRHPELWKTHVVRYADDDISVESTEDNLADITPEIDQYLDLNESIYSNRSGLDVCYAGVNDPALDGVREQAVIDCGHDVLPTTRIGQMIEHDIFTHDQRHRR